MRKGIISCVLLLFLACSAEQSVYSRSKHDVILVLDTSMSMIGYGGRDIFADVQKSIYTYIDSLEDGDRVTFVRFDSDVQIFPTVILDDANDRDILKKYISITPAKGKWTYTNQMLDNVFQRAVDMQKEEEHQGRQLVIIVMTDGIDDPPPAISDRKDIKDIASKFADAGEKWWVYLVDYKSLEEHQKRRLQEGLKGVTDIQIIDGTDPAEGMNKVMEKERSRYTFPIVIAIIIFVILILLAIMYYMKRQAQLKVRGALEYWNNDMIKPYIERFEMNKYLAREIQIGNALGSQLRLREFEGKEPFKLVAVRNKNNDIKVQLKIGLGSSVEFISGEQKEFLEKGDTFRIANHSFRYLP